MFTGEFTARFLLFFSVFLFYRHIAVAADDDDDNDDDVGHCKSWTLTV